MKKESNLAVSLFAGSIPDPLVYERSNETESKPYASMNLARFPAVEAPSPGRIQSSFTAPDPPNCKSTVTLFLWAAAIKYYKKF